MEQSLLYLREILSAHTDSDGVGSQLYHKLSSQNYQDELQFIRELSQEESTYLHQILDEAIGYAQQSQDEVRVQHLNSVYEQIFI